MIVVLDNGTVSLGIEFTAKHGQPAADGCTCWVYWMRNLDFGLEEPLERTKTESIELDDADFKTALVHCKIESR